MTVMTSNSVEDLILSNLIHNEFYLRNVVPYLQDDYFTNSNYVTVYHLIKEYFDKYNSLPSVSALYIDLENLSLNTNDYNDVKQIIERIQDPCDADYDWVKEKTEKFCQDRAVYNAIMESIAILDNKSDKDKGAITQILEEALSVSFDTHIGHDFLEDFEERYDFYHRKVERIPFDIKMLNRITKEGLPRKTLNLILAGCVHPDTKVRIRYKKTNQDA